MNYTLRDLHRRERGHMDIAKARPRHSVMGLLHRWLWIFRNNRYARNGSARALSDLADPRGPVLRPPYFNASGVLTTAAINEPALAMIIWTQSSRQDFG